MYIKMTQQCVATTKGNQRCKNQAKKDHELCASHYRKKYGSNTKNEKGETIEKKKAEAEESADEGPSGFLAPTTMKPVVVKSSPRRLSPRKTSPYRKTSPRRLSPGRRGNRRTEEGILAKTISSDSEEEKLEKGENAERDEKGETDEKTVEKAKTTPPSSPPKVLTRNENTKFLSFGTVKNKLLSPRRRLKRI